MSDKYLTHGLGLGSLGDRGDLDPSEGLDLLRVHLGVLGSWLREPLVGELHGLNSVGDLAETIVLELLQRQEHAIFALGNL